jgi:hypothetical protein
MSGCYQPVPNVGITWMAGWIGPILAVRLLGRASIYLMAPASQAFQLAWTNRTTGLPSGQDGSFRASSRQRHPAPGGSPCPERKREECRTAAEGEAIVAGRRCSVSLCSSLRRSGRASCSRLRHEATERSIYAGQRGNSQPVPCGMPTEWARQPGFGPDAPRWAPWRG